MNLHSLPKVELHLHLDCSLSFRVVSKLAPEISKPDYEGRFIAPEKCDNLADYLRRASEGIRLMQREHQLRLATEDLFEQLAEDHVIYAEVRFAPLQHLQGGLSAEEVVTIVDDATERASRATGIEARLILCTLRHFTKQQSMETVQLVKQFQGSRVAGFDIAGDEAGYPIDAHIAAFRFANDHGIACTAHAGEARGSISVWETLNHFKPLRIGHGVRSIEDPMLMQHLKDARTHLEVCPTCNVQTDICRTYRDHPVDTLYRFGLSVGINTDTRTITNVTLTKEYERLREIFQWSVRDFFQCNVNALKAAFIEESLKDSLMKRLTDAYRFAETP